MQMACYRTFSLEKGTSPAKLGGTGTKIPVELPASNASDVLQGLLFGIAHLCKRHRFGRTPLPPRGTFLPERHGRFDGDGGTALSCHYLASLGPSKLYMPF